MAPSTAAVTALLGSPAPYFDGQREPSSRTFEWFSQLFLRNARIWSGPSHGVTVPLNVTDFTLFECETAHLWPI